MRSPRGPKHCAQCEGGRSHQEWGSVLKRQVGVTTKGGWLEWGKGAEGLTGVAMPWGGDTVL